MSDIIQNYASKIDEFYKEHSIYKSLVITSNKDELNELVNVLDSLNHSVYTLGTPPKFDNFMDINYRVIVITYADVLKFGERIKKTILPEQNLVMYTEIPDKDGIVAWVQQAVCDGYNLKDHAQHFLDLTG